MINLQSALKFIGIGLFALALCVSCNTSTASFELEAHSNEALTQSLLNFKQAASEDDYHALINAIADIRTHDTSLVTQDDFLAFMDGKSAAQVIAYARKLEIKTG